MALNYFPHSSAHMLKQLRDKHAQRKIYLGLFIQLFTDTYIHMCLYGCIHVQYMSSALWLNSISSMSGRSGISLKASIIAFHSSCIKVPLP